MRFLVAFFLFFLVGAAKAEEKVILKVFHAGSLSVPFAAMERAFEARYPWIDVRREPSGSVLAIRKVTELKKPCDVVASADYVLIPKMMFPHYADHVYLFARNELVLCYTPRSRFAKEINEKNWFEILARPRVKWGFSNPNIDPCGYRTVMMIALAELHYQKPLLETLLGSYLPISWEREGEEILITVPQDLVPRGRKVFVRPKSVELLGLLESGALDYAVEYVSVARQHGLRYLPLPPQINLGHREEEAFYRRVKIRLGTGKLVRGGPIIYGIAALKTAPHPKEARLFEAFVIGPEGERILKENFQIPLRPAQEIRVSP